jgi:hypothetical protein
MQEMMDAVGRRTAPDMRQHQRKCTVMFELSVTLVGGLYMLNPVDLGIKLESS